MAAEGITVGSILKRIVLVTWGNQCHHWWQMHEHVFNDLRRARGSHPSKKKNGSVFSAKGVTIEGIERDVQAPAWAKGCNS